LPPASGQVREQRGRLSAEVTQSPPFTGFLVSPTWFE